MTAAVPMASSGKMSGGFVGHGRLPVDKAAQCLYVGDAQRDIEAGLRAGLRTVVALFGYIGEDDHPEEWQADALLNTPREIEDWIAEITADEPAGKV